MASNIIFNKDFDSKTVYVMKVYKGSVSEVWNYFTRPELLDQWWGPKPWRCETVQMDFKKGGKWRYAMVGPDGEKMYAQVEFGEIMEHRSFDGMDTFCDAEGNVNKDFPPAQWLYGFTGVDEGVKVTVNIHFSSEEAMKQLIEMGFEDGFKMGLNQLEEILDRP
ncbi:SRPBCC family protein [Chryseobacterium sp. CT-SW4]|uniref:SRPBCC family protein n=1 Tax=Chryseobacterium sp. SW-1 TaxID=3157343 RepID=UPI003B0124B4